MDKTSTSRAALMAVLFAIAFTASTPASGASYFVSPGGSPSGDGSIERPWDLATALSQTTAVRPGDAIWLRGGRYTFPAGGDIRCGLRGTASSPITVAQYPGERATLDLKGAARGLFFTNSPNPAGPAYVHFKDFEITNSDTKRAPGMPVAIWTQTSDHLKFINLIIHDTGEGFYLSPAATNTEVYGCLVYYNGALDGMEHGIYIQNVSGYKKAIDNITFHNAGFGIHAFPHDTDSALLDVSLIGNIAFNNGLLGKSNPHADILLGGQAIAMSPILDANATYKAAPGSLWNQMIGYSAGCSNPTVTDNYFVGAVLFTACTSDLIMTSNTFYGALLTRDSFSATPTTFDASSFPVNSLLSSRPAKTQVIVRPNLYRAGRANIAVYNWSLQDTVDVNVEGVLNHGDHYEVRSAQDYFGAPIRTGVYDGQPLRLPMSGRTPSQPVGFDTPPATGPEFQVFVLTVTLYARLDVHTTGQQPPPVQVVTPRP